MYIKEKFKNPDEYREWFVSLLEKIHKAKYERVWRDEDYPILLPFFKYQERLSTNQRAMVDEEVVGYEHYLKCKEEYADALFELRDHLGGFTEDQLADIFGFTYEELSDEVGEWQLDSNCDFDFPMIVIGNAETGGCTSDSYQNASICFVSLSDFDGLTVPAVDA